MNQRFQASLSLLSELQRLRGKLKAELNKLAELQSRFRIRQPSKVQSIDDVLEPQSELQVVKPVENAIARLELRIAEIKLELAGQTHAGKELSKLRQGRKITDERRKLYLAIDDALERNKTMGKRKLSTRAMIKNLCSHDQRFRNETSDNLRRAYGRWVKGGRK